MKPAKGASKVFIFIIIILFRSENQSRVPRTLAENRYTMGIVPLCTPIPFALSRSFHSVPPIIRGQAASNYFIGASAVPDKRPRIDPFSFRSAEHVYRIVLRKVSAATFSARFSTVEREIQPRPTPFFTPFPRPSRKQPSVILFHRVFNKDRD